MDFLNVIRRRRSIRRYVDKIVEDHLLDAIIEAGLCAPSAGNACECHCVVINDKKILKQIAEVHPYAHMAPSASHAICVCADLSAEAYPGNYPADAGAMTQNLLLACTALNLGCVWVGIYPDTQRIQDFRNLLKLPESILPFSLVPIGYPAEIKPPNQHHDKSRIHTNQWHGQTYE